MELKTDFQTFLSSIRPTDTQKKDLQAGHKLLRERLNAFEGLKDIIVSDFLQGSYRRATAVRPKGETRSDVDIIVVTNLSEEDYTPAAAMALFEPFLDKHYKGKWRPQGRSFGIELSAVELDLVLTSAPSEAEIQLLTSESVRSSDDIELARDWRLHPLWLGLEHRTQSNAALLLKEAASQPEWKLHPLRIPDRNANQWESTHPLEQIRWTRDKNSSTNTHYVNVVKAIKWWRLEKHEDPKHPKGFPLERLIGECCPDNIGSVAQGITETLEAIVSNYVWHVSVGSKPTLPDYGVVTHDVFARITPEDFKKFYDQVAAAAILARQALDSQDRTESGNLWRELLGSKFPEPPNNGGSGKNAFTPPSAPAVPGSGRFA
ncbi:hypothetical protein D3C72_61620 [compost metagenome]